ncbi:MAG: hypothetical protein ACRD15_11925 [Vicinamibacterales bacterium]
MTIVAAALLVGASVATPEIIDRVLAVVDAQIITLSDVRAAIRFELVPADVSEDPVNAALQRLIDRRVMLAEVDRYAPAEPEAGAIDAAIAVVSAKSKDALAFETELNRYGLSQEELRRFMRDSLRLEEYLQQRFASTGQPSDGEVARYYQEHPGEFTVEGQLRPFDDVRDQARASVSARRRSEFVQEWVAGLRRRASLVVLYLPARK